MIQQLTRDRVGLVESYFLDRQLASSTVTVYTGEGVAVVSDATCQVDTAATTLSSAAVAGATSLALAAAGGLVVGRRYLLGGTAESKEAVTVESTATGTVVLVAPLVYAHASAAPLVGLRVWYDTTVGDAAQLWWDGYAVFQPGNGSREQTESVDCVRRAIPTQLIDETDARKVIPKDMNALSEEFDYRQGLVDARDQLLIDLGGKNRANTILGVDYFRRPCALKFWLMRRYEFGEEWAAVLDKMQDEYDALVQKIIAQAPVDADQDGSTTGPDDRGYTVISLERA